MVLDQFQNSKSDFTDPKFLMFALPEEIPVYVTMDKREFIIFNLSFLQFLGNGSDLETSNSSSDKTFPILYSQVTHMLPYRWFWLSLSTLASLLIRNQFSTTSKYFHIFFQQFSNEETRFGCINKFLILSMIMPMTTIDLYKIIAIECLGKMKWNEHK